MEMQAPNQKPAAAADSEPAADTAEATQETASPTSAVAVSGGNRASKKRVDSAVEAKEPTPRAELLKVVRETSDSPGVYLMKDPAGGILYVGKAKNLRNRLASYFQTGPHEVPRTEMMVSRVHRFDVILTETEAEALVLENTLIKKYKPKFNVRLKDDKTYPYLKIQVNEAFPRLQWTRKVLRDGARYFGPFPSAWSLRRTMALLNETFQLRDCSDNTFRHRSRPCILYQMGKCTAPCVGKIDQPSYHGAIEEVAGILGGNTEKLVGTLRKGMEDAAAEEQYELAADYRDQIRNLELVTQTQGAVEPGSDRDRDVIGLARAGIDAHVAIVRIRGGRIIGVKHMILQNTDASQADADVLSEFLSQYYFSLVEGARESLDAGRSSSSASAAVADENPPQEVLVAAAPSEVEMHERMLGLRILVPDSPREEQLLTVARANADYALEQAVKRTAGHGFEALEEVMDKLHLSKLPHRIECYDNSNIGGEDATASRVVFIDGAPDKNLYRRYKIRTVEGSNDFATMREVLGRRFAHASDPTSTDSELPDLVVVDGGKGQLSQAVAILEELQVQGVAVVGLAKARTEKDFRSAEVKSSFERIFIPNRKNPVPLLPHTAAYKLLTHVRDEAHRFAISYHRLLRSKRTLGGGAK